MANSATKERFNIGLFNASNIDMALQAEMEMLKMVDVFESDSRGSRVDFDEICAKFREHMDAKFSEMSKNAKRQAGANKSNNEDDNFIQLEHDAIVGVPEVVTTVMEEIQTFLNNHNNPEIWLPSHYEGLHLHAPPEQTKYSNLAHAVFHETYGFKVLAAWRKYPASYAMQVIGTAVWIHHDGKHRLMYRFKSKDEVEKIVRSLTRQKDDAKINEYKTTLELDLFTGERVTMTIEPAVKNHIITFRRYLIGQIIISDLAKEDKKTIPLNSVPLFRSISHCHCNMAIVGPPRTGKSTTLKAMIGEREASYTGAIIEKHYELAASLDNPDMKLIEMIANEQNFAYVFDQVLRFDVDWASIGELRRVEIEGIMLACERLMKGMLTTYHTWKPQSIPRQWARLNCNLHPGMNEELEMRRVAENLDIVAVQFQDPSKKQKRIVGLREMRYNPFNGEISTHSFMHWHKETDSWTYRYDISDQLLGEMYMMNDHWAKIFETTLKQLASDHPMPANIGVEIYNPIEANPNHRIATTLEKLYTLLSDKLGGGVL